MTQVEKQNLECLLEIAREENSPLSSWEKEFVSSLARDWEREMTMKQRDIFARLIEKHVEGMDE